VWSRSGRELFYVRADGLIMASTYRTDGDLFVPEKPRVWSAHRLADVGFYSSFDVAADSKRIVAVRDADDVRPETHVRVLLQVGDRVRRQIAASAK
jgi:hypothetical protein